MFRYPKRLTKEQKLSIISEHLEGGFSISELSRKHQVSAHSIYKWKADLKKQEQEVVSIETGDLLNEIERLKKENSCLKHTVADLTLDVATLKQWNDFVKKKLREEKLNLQRSLSGKKSIGSQKKGSVS